VHQPKINTSILLSLVFGTRQVVQIEKTHMNLKLNIKNAVKGLLPYISIIIVLFSFFKAGRFPAASAGDEVWWSEAGYWLIQKGTLAWDMHDDQYGNAEKSFWPPITAVFQALNIKIFGLTPVGIMVQAPIVALLTGLSIFVLGRALGHKKTACHAAAIAVLGFTAVDLRIGRVRMETLAMPFYISMLFMIFKAAKINRSFLKYRTVILIFAGLLVGVACLTYYPQAPFYLTGGLYCVVLLGRWKIFDLNDIVMFLMGGAVVLLAAIVWVYPDFSRFFQQLMLTNAEQSIKGLYLHLSPFNRGMSAIDLLSAFELILVICFISLAIVVTRSRIEKAIFLACVPPCFVWTIYSTSGMAMIAFAIGPMALIQILRESDRLWFKRIAQAAIVFLIFSAIGRQALIGDALLAQWNSRDYNYVSRSISTMNLGPGKVGISQSAWLGLRGTTGQGDLHLMMPKSAGLPYSNRSKVLYGVSHLDEFSAFVVDADSVQQLRSDYRLFDKAISSGQFTVIGHIKPDFIPALRAPKGPYNLVVYRRRETALYAP